ncbi:MAG: 16S rRNA (cytosine(1402)-N(4))-methyltransferase RsmH, partial [Candidatus Sungbacteria bacterium]|nr:16S rRNA (cytosine(1402)-N(4))-methyltransferase RsmH [Candidatus Sungbacteria bacterium]
DLGFGLHTLEDSGKGFSFRKDEPLIMRYGEDGGPSAADMLNTKSAVDLEKIFNEYGEERFSKRIAERIVEERRRAPIKRTTDLVRIIREVVPERYKKGALDPATRTFQALRIAVNDEFGNIRNGLEAALRVLADNGRIAVIAFHSGEDRIAKEVFKQAAKNGALEIITKHVIKPHRSEILLNRASRSAKLRVGIKHIV